MKVLILVLTALCDLQSLNGSLMGPWIGKMNRHSTGGADYAHSDGGDLVAAPSRYQQYYAGASVADPIATSQNVIETALATVAHGSPSPPVPFVGAEPVAPTPAAAGTTLALSAAKIRHPRNMSIKKRVTEHDSTFDGNYFDKAECPNLALGIETDIKMFYDHYLPPGEFALVVIVGSLLLNDNLLSQCTVAITGVQMSDCVNYEYEMQEMTKVKSFTIMRGKPQVYEIAFPIRKKGCLNQKMESAMWQMNNCSGKLQIIKLVIDMDFNEPITKLTSGQIIITEKPQGDLHTLSFEEMSALFPLFHSAFENVTYSDEDYLTYESYFAFEALTTLSEGCKMEKIDEDGNNNEAGIKWSGESAVNDHLNAKLNFSDDDSILDVGLSADSSIAKTPRRNTNKRKWGDSLKKPAIPVVEPVDSKQHQLEEDEDSLCGKAVTAFLRRLPDEKKANFRYELEGLKLKYSGI